LVYDTEEQEDVQDQQCVYPVLYTMFNKCLFEKPKKQINTPIFPMYINNVNKQTNKVLHCIHLYVTSTIPGQSAYTKLGIIEILMTEGVIVHIKR